MSVRSAAYMQAIRGPVLLITLGVLFELQQSGGLPFWKTWPFLLIAIGIMKLIEWAAGGQEPQGMGPQQPYAPQQARTWGGQPYSQPWPGYAGSGQASPSQPFGGTAPTQPRPAAGTPPPVPQTPAPPQGGLQS